VNHWFQPLMIKNWSQLCFLF